MSEELQQQPPAAGLSEEEIENLKSGLLGLMRDEQLIIELLKDAGVYMPSYELPGDRYAVLEYQEAANSYPSYWKSGDVVYQRVVAIYYDSKSADAYAAELMVSRTDLTLGYRTKLCPVFASSREIENGMEVVLMEPVSAGRYSRDDRQARHESNQPVEFRIAAHTPSRRDEARAWLAERLGEDYIEGTVFTGPSQHDNMWWLKGGIAVPPQPLPPEPVLELRTFQHRPGVERAIPRRRRRKNNASN
jgi:hypothetical protein